MPLPPKAIEQLGREPIRTPGWSGRVLMFTGTIFFLAAAVFFGIKFGSIPYWQSRLSEAEGKISVFEQRVPAEKQEKVLVFYSQLSNLEELLDKQKFSSAAFSFLERATQGGVYFSRFTLDLPQSKITLSGNARALDDVSRQLFAFNQSAEVDKVIFGGATLGADNVWSFSVTLLLKDRTLMRSGQQS